jgi:hypothetical protein
MKKTMLFMITAIIINNVNAQQITNGDFQVGFNFGSFGGGMNFISKDFNLSSSLINFFIGHEKTNIGIEINPIKYTANFSYLMQEWNQNLYFINGNLYWNIFGIKSMIFGPFISINYLSVENWSNFNANDYIFSSGIRFFSLTRFKNFFSMDMPFQIIGSEIGYRNISGRHNFYFNVNIDISWLFALTVWTAKAMGDNLIEEHERKYR